MNVSLGLPPDDEKSAVEYKHDLLFRLAEAIEAAARTVSLEIPCDPGDGRLLPSGVDEHYSE